MVQNLADQQAKGRERDACARTGVMMSDLNQKILPCFRTNQRRRQVLMYSPEHRTHSRSCMPPATSLLRGPVLDGLTRALHGLKTASCVLPVVTCDEGLIQWGGGGD